MGRVVVILTTAAAVVACSVATVMVRRRVKRRRKWRKVVGLLKELEESFETPLERLRQMVDAIAVEMQAGLVSEGGSKLKMLLTFVDDLPNGSERGTYYALHLGGSYFRIIRVHLGGQRSSLEVQDIERHSIPTSLLNSTSEVLFDFLASSLQRFIEKEGHESISSQDVKRELAFTFSFPVKQTSLSSGVLIKWTKGFAISEMAGEDIAECLQGAVDRRGLDIHVAALVNDTVGALSYGHYHDPDTIAAVVVNMEWGNFWSSRLPRTSYDIELDAESLNSNDMGFEKMIGGMYLGDIVRRVILRMSQESDIFGPISSILSTPFVLRTNSVSAMHEDDTPELHEVATILKHLGVSKVPLKVRKLVVKICDVVTRRAARLAAAGISGILKKLGRDGSVGEGRRRSSDKQMMRRTVVAVEGGLYSNYRMFREYMDEALRDILGEDVARQVVIKAMEDGSSIGSALLLASSHSVRTISNI
ncbi:hypothetical protein Bca52824_065838 [Brassica carinata]|uniref:Phosphotransferase n=1 Tax=Brassica carinata TaxID=52824 RepID=A0A8X7QK39_BRACI|nr:hypothetical protein Bca52824_065838 [Brassica carinata]